MLEKLWSGNNKLYWLLIPLSWLYAFIVLIRKECYRLGLFKSWKAPIPVIVVGNLSVGGNGKTPIVIYLIEQLVANGYKVGVVSRGYGGKSDNYPVIVTKQTTAKIVGDEPLLIYQRTDVPVAVSPNRCDAVKTLLKHHQLDIIITDDGLQHYALQRDIEIVVIDGKRGFGNGWHLPAGPMRESTSRLKTVDFLIINGQSDAHYFDAYTMDLEPSEAINLLTKERKSLHQLGAVCAMAGIGYPARFFNMLKHYQVNVIHTLSFMDHELYSKKQLIELIEPTSTLLMTEKDAVKCMDFAQANWWYVPVDAKVSPQFIESILGKCNQLL